jgi:hypothetical protein
MGNSYVHVIYEFDNPHLVNDFINCVGSSLGLLNVEFHILFRSQMKTRWRLSAKTLELSSNVKHARRVFRANIFGSNATEDSIASVTTLARSGFPSKLIKFKVKR